MELTKQYEGLLSPSTRKENGPNRYSSALVDFRLPQAPAGTQERLQQENDLICKMRDEHELNLSNTLDYESKKVKRWSPEALDIVRGESKVFFLQDPGRTGKTCVGKSPAPVRKWDTKVTLVDNGVSATAGR